MNLASTPETRLPFTDVIQLVIEALKQDNTNILGQLYTNIALNYPDDPRSEAILEAIYQRVTLKTNELNAIIIGEIRDITETYNAKITIQSDTSHTDLNNDLETINNQHGMRTPQETITARRIKRKIIKKRTRNKRNAKNRNNHVFY